MKAFVRVPATFGILFLLSVPADAHDPSMPHHEWFNKQEMNPTTQHRLGLPDKSCCSNGDVFKTCFRVAEDRSDQWQYLKDGEWKTIPPGIIKEDDTPDHTPVLFIDNASSYREEASDERLGSDTASKNCTEAAKLGGWMSGCKTSFAVNVRCWDATRTSAEVVLGLAFGARTTRQAHNLQ